VFLQILTLPEVFQRFSKGKVVSLPVLSPSYIDLLVKVKLYAVISDRDSTDA